MKKILLLLLTAVLAISVVPAFAKRDVVMRVSIQEALANRQVQEAIRHDVALFWGDQPHPAVSNKRGVIKTNKRSNAFRKLPSEACQWAFAGAVRALQDSALRAGGNGLVNVQSNISDIPYVSDNTFECAVGAMMVNVALKATIVTLN